MLSDVYTNNKLFLTVSACILFLTILLFVYNGSYVLLAVPLVWLYCVLVVKDWKAAYWTLLFSLPFSTSVSLQGNSLSLCVPDEPMMWIFLILSMLLAASRNSEIKGWWYLNPIVIIVCLQFAWLILSVVYSTVPFYSLKFLLSKTWLLGAFFILPIWIFKDKKDLKAAFLVLMVPVLITMLYIVTVHAYHHFRFSDINEAIGFLYQNHVEYAAVISMFFPFVFIACLWYKGRDRKMSRIFFAIAAFFIMLIFLSYARAAMVALIFSFIVYYAVKKKRAQLLMPGIYGIIALILVFAVRGEKYLELRPDAKKTYMYWDFSEHMLATFQGRDESSMERLYRWIAAIRMSEAKPIFGYGPHGFYYNYQNYALSSFRTYASRNKEHSTTHNYFLYMLTEQGYPAMILYALLNIVVFVRGQRIYHRFKDRFYKLCTMGILMLFAASFVNNFFSELIDTHKVGAMFFIALALLVILDRKSMEEQNAVA